MNWFLKYDNDPPFMACQTITPLLSFIYQNDNDLWLPDKTRNQALTEAYQKGITEITLRDAENTRQINVTVYYESTN